MLAEDEQLKHQTLPNSLYGYQVIRRIGEGAGSTIYAVADPRTGLQYALKQVLRRSEKDDRFIAQLENEFEVSRKFRHPGLRRCIELKYGRSFLRKINDVGLVMELVEGTPLHLQDQKDVPEVLDIFIQTARILGGLHYLRLVHCDLKPNNILITPSGQVKLIDFGQACPIGTTKERIQGTPDFIAPEQVKLRPVSLRTDVFNFGATLYWALSGRRIPTLFTVSKSDRDVVLECKFPSPRELNDRVPPALSDLVMQCIHVEPGRRPEDMGEVGRRLEEIQRDVMA